MAEQNTLEVRIGGDVEGFERAANAARKTLDDFEKKVVQSAAAIDGSTKRSADAQAKYLTELAKRYDPAIRAQERYAKSLADINLLVKANVYNEQQATAALTRALSERTASIQRATGQQETALTAGARGFRSFGGAVQQVGFQIGDFATQVAGGSGVLRPLIQQGTQVVSMFGPWGAVIGAAGAAVGALAVTFLDLESGTREAEKATKGYEETLKSLQAVIDEIDGKGKTRIERLREEVNEQKQLVRVEIAKTQALVDQARVRAELAQMSDPETAFGVGNAELERIKQLQKVIDEAQKRVEALDEKYMEAANAVYNDEQVEKTRKAVEDLTKAEEKRLEIIRQYDLDRVHQQEKDRAAAQERGRKIIEDDQKAREKSIEDVRRAQEKADEERLRAAERHAEQLERTTGRVLDNISEAGGDILFDAWEGKAANFWETFTRFGKRALAQLAAEQVTQSLFRPVVSGAVSSLPGLFGISGSSPGAGTIAGTANGGSGLGFSNLSSLSSFVPSSWTNGLTSSINAFGASYLGLNSAAAAQGAASTYGISAGQAAALSNAGGLGSTASLSGILGGAGIGFGAGQLLRGFTDNKWISGGGGALAGAGAGFMMGGPIGAAVGGIAGLLGGVIGKGKGVGPNANAYTGVQDGRLVFGGAGGSKMSSERVAAEAQRLVAAGNVVIDQFDGQLAWQNHAGLTGRYGVYDGAINAGLPGTADEAFVNLVRDRMLTGSGTTGTVLANTAGTSIQSIIDDLNFGKLFDQLSRLQRPANDARDAIESLSKAFDENSRRAASLGLSAEALRSGTATNFNQDIDRAIKGITDPLGAALEDFAEVEAARLEYARKIGADIVDVERLNMLERQKIAQQGGANIERWLQDQLLGATSTMTGSGRLSEAQGQLQAAMAANDNARVLQLGDLIASLYKDLYGGTTAAAQGIADLRGSIGRFGKVQGFAGGTTSAPAGWHWVGERGPELMRFRGGEQVVPAEQSAQMARSQAVSSALMADEMQSLRRSFDTLATTQSALLRDFQKILNKVAA